jgi:fumarylacetoacetase
VPLAALEPFRVAQATHEPPLLPYLRDPDGCNYDVPLYVEIKGAFSAADVLQRTR